MFDIKSLLGIGSYLGVDIGTTSIKIVEISKEDKRLKLENYGILESHGHLERINDVIQTSDLKIEDRQTAALLKILLEQGRFGSRDAVASVPAFSSFVTLLETPQMPESDTEKNLKFQIRQHIPLPSSEVAIDWQKVGEIEDEKGFIRQRIVLVAVPNEQIAKYQSIFKSVGLKLRALEMESLSLARALASADYPPSVIADIGGRSTNIAVIDKGSLVYNSQTDCAGASLTHAIASGLQINVRRAEDLKKRKGLIAGDEFELSTLTSIYLDAIINEIKRGIENYERKRDIKIEQVILTGGGANLPGIESYFKEQIGIPAIVGNSFSGLVYPDKIEPLVKELGSKLSVAVGLGMREFSV